MQNDLNISIVHCEDNFLNITIFILVLLPINRTEICAMAPEIGDGRASITRFFYDKSTGTCKEFFWGGFGGNKNNFNTLEDCLSKCKGQ